MATLPYVSYAVIVNWSELPAVILPEAADKLKLAADKGFTVTVIELLVNAVVPPVALMVAFCISYKVIKPPEVDTPLLKVITSELPKLTAVVALLLTVGL